MRLRSVLTEALRNVSSGTTRAGVFALLLIVLGGGLIAADVAETRTFLAEAASYQSAGASTMTIVAPGQVDGRRCDLLRHLPGVQGAGALRKSPEAATLTALPDAPLARYDITPSFSTVLTHESSSGGGILISTEVATAVRRLVGDDLMVDQTNARIQGVYDYPADGRRAGLGWAVLVPTTTTSGFDECWVRQWPQDPGLRTQLMQVITPSIASAGDQPVVAAVNETLGVRFTGTQRFHDRVLQYVPLALLVVAAGLGVLSVRSRRLELASNLHAGARRRDIHAQALVETVLWASVAGAAVFGTALALAAPVGGPDRFALIFEGGRGAAAILIGCIAGASLAVTRIRERDFFAYFKDRG